MQNWAFMEQKIPANVVCAISFHLMIFKSRDKQSMLTWIHRYCVASQINLFFIYSVNKNLMVVIHFVPTLLTSGSILIQFTLPTSQYNIPASASMNKKK